MTAAPNEPSVQQRGCKGPAPGKLGPAVTYDRLAPGEWSPPKTTPAIPGESLLPYICDAHGRDYAVWELELDEGVRHFVRVLSDHGVETFQSCQGGPGHAFAEPTVQFHGTEAAGWHALAVALDHGLPVTDMQRTWRIDQALAPVGPHWELVLDSKCWWRVPEKGQSEASQARELAEDFIGLYECVVDADPDVRESWWKTAHNASLLLGREPTEKMRRGGT